MNPKKIISRVLALVCALTVVALVSFAQTQQAPQSMKLAKVEFRGLQHLTQAQVLEISGLVIGEPITVDSLEAAAQKMVDSGLFGKITYRIRSVKTDATVEFEVDELSRTYPVVFDNFVWFSDDELHAGVKSEMPTFNGTAPESGGAPDLIKKALARMLRAANINGEVEYILSTDANGGNARHVFKVNGVKIPVCSVHYSGNESVSEGELLERSNVLLQNDFSREAATAFPRPGLLPIYRNMGRLKAQINFDNAKLVESEQCKDGVNLNFIVDEGDIYTWAGSEWVGVNSVSTQDLDRALGMKIKDVASGTRIDKGIIETFGVYAKHGYMGAIIKPTLEFDDNARTVKYRFAVSEGPQYKMGSLAISGLSEVEAANLRKLWKLGPTDVFDDLYASQFFSRAVQSLKRHGVVGVKPNKENLTVDVDIRFDK